MLNFPSFGYGNSPRTLNRTDFSVSLSSHKQFAITPRKQDVDSLLSSVTTLFHLEIFFCLQFCLLIEGTSGNYNHRKLCPPVNVVLNWIGEQDKLIHFEDIVQNFLLILQTNSPYYLVVLFKFWCFLSHAWQFTRQKHFGKFSLSLWSLSSWFSTSAQSSIHYT